MIMPLNSRTPPRLDRPTSVSRSPQDVARTPIVYFFLDFSNIALSAGGIALEHGDRERDRQFLRLSCANLRHFVERNRIWGRGYAAAALPNQDSAIGRCFRRVGIDFDICERGRISGKEQNVDERIQLEMLRLLDPSVEIGTVALATGDGDGFQDNRGFLAILSQLHHYGFSIEVMSWQHSFNRVLRDWAGKHGRAIELDDFYPDLTFIKGGREASPQHQLSNKLIRTGLLQPPMFR